METMVEATTRLREAGYVLDLSPLAGGKLRCGERGEIVDARFATVAETVRFEGVSNPDDQAILTALICPSGHMGLFSAAYGPTAAPQEEDVLLALTNR
jgi:hypothetical protein